MGKKYTVLVCSQRASKVKKFIISHLTLKIGAAALALLLVVSGYLLYDYLSYQKKLFDLRDLRTEIFFQQGEIQNFLQKISIMEEELTRLKKMEEQVMKDLKEVQELKREKKVKKVVPPVASPKPTEPSEATETKQKSSFFRQEEVSILEKERPRLVSRLHQELLELSNEAFKRVENLKGLQEILQAQKSVLHSIPFLWPVIGRITSGYGDTRLSISSGGTRPHRGLDIAAQAGTPVVAPADGVVTFAGRESEYGRLVTIDHGHGYCTFFGHLKNIYVLPGEKVKIGKIIGAVGSSGNSSGPHLHYEVRINGHTVNPASFLNRKS